MKIWDAFVGLENRKVTFSVAREISKERQETIPMNVRAIINERRRPLRIDCSALADYHDSLVAANKDVPLDIKFIRPPFDELFLQFGPNLSALINFVDATGFNALFMAFDEDNQNVFALGNVVCLASDKFILDPPIDHRFPEAYETEARDLFDACSRMLFLSLKLMSCRNIELVDYRIPPALARSQAKKGRIPKLEFKTIHIKGFSRSEVGRPKTEPAEPLLPKHIVMGHLRTYSAERPLFGKHVGTYWVPQHSRGDVKNGIVVKDYVLDQPL